MTKLNYKNRERGLILIELLTAVAIFAIEIVVIFALFVNATQGVIVGLEKTRGILLSNESLEAAYAISKKDPDYLTPGKYEVGANNNNQWALIPKTGLMGHFLLANNVKDSSIYKNKGLMHKVTFAEDRKDQPLAAARFNGTDSYIKTELAFSLQIEGPLTLAAWVLDTGMGEGRRTIASKGVYKLYKEDSNYYFAISGGEKSDVIEASSEGLGWWEHIVGVYDPGGPTLHLYVNGKEKASKPTNITSIKIIPEIEFFIGAEPDLSNFWEGRISDVRVYNRALTSNEIAGLYNSYSVPYQKSLVVSDSVFEQDEKTKIWKLNDKELVGIWNFNEGEGCTANDNSQNNNHGIVRNCSPTQWVENRQEKLARAFKFDGNNYIEIANSSTLQVKDKISISLWLKIETLPEQDMTILQKKAAGSDDFSFALVYKSVEKGFGWAASVGMPEEFNQVKIAAGSVIPNKWQNIIVTFDGVNKKIYIDGQEISNLSETTLKNTGSNSNLFLGQNAQATIDDLRIYQKILEPKEIKAIFLEKTSYYLE
jgi:type II secretory pathway pseudopilin PulG